MAKQVSRRDVRRLSEAAKKLAAMPAAARRDAGDRAMQMLRASNARGLKAINGVGSTAGLRAEAERLLGARSGKDAEGVFADVMDLIGGQNPGNMLAREVVRYARSGSVGAVLRSVLGQLGPVGSAISWIFGRAQSQQAVQADAIRKAVEILQGLGIEVRLPNAGQPSMAPIPIGSHRNTPFEDRDSGPAQGGGAGGGTRGPTPPGTPINTPPGVPPSPPSSIGRILPVGSLPAGKGISMIRVDGSSNVYAYGYQESTRTMRVQFLGATINRSALRGHGHRGRNRVRGRLGRTVTGTRRGPGPTYDYQNVPPKVFARFDAAASKGKAVWDELRVRGTAWGHKFDYQLTATSVSDVVLPVITPGGMVAGRRVGSITYVPRRAVGPGMFQGRSLLQGQGNRIFRSILPNQGMRDTRDRRP